MADITHIIEVAVTGSAASGKTTIQRHLIETAKSLHQHDLCFDEHHSHAEMDCEHHDVVLQIIDANNLREALQMTSSFVDHRHHLVLALNRYKKLQKSGHSIDIDKFSSLIGVPIITVEENEPDTIIPLIEAIRTVSTQEESHAHPIYHAWEQDDEAAYKAYMEGVLAEVLIHPDDDTHTYQEWVNRLLTHRVFGFIILAAILSVVFYLTFAIGGPLQDLMQLGIDKLYDLSINTLPDQWYRSLLADGIILGVGSLLTALPNIIVLFFMLSIMEDSGYLARVSFLMDGIMHRIGLHGRSFIPLLMGFDCNVPAIMAAKDIMNPKHRALTMLMVPFMSCSARLPVYILFISIFFTGHKALVLGSLYLLGVLLSFGFAWIMTKTPWFRSDDDNSVNELPDFMLPTWGSIGRHIWFRVKDFLQKISTVVLCSSIIIWALEYFPAQDLSMLDTSYLAQIGRWLEPIFSPLGFDWKMSVCLLTGLPAKESIAATFSILFGADAAAASLITLTPVSAYAFLVFTLLYFPCVATISTLRRELGFGWAAFTVVHTLLLAWFMAFLANTIGNLII